MRYNLLITLRPTDYGYGWEIRPGVSYPLGHHKFPTVCCSGTTRDPDKYNKKIPKEYT